ncbi:anoctamin-5 isoform X2 [Tribolium castaneum]|uniref:Anoctamin n=1 Tax=Tribolium castaneum TaxID=7070 RepID=D6WLJ8_TRICA|nr:PREDICTED: anoctamin-5 isoform X2 [Tribolium castaneum]EFA04121.2 Anoctamin-1-like Protein [Tribolium castaneum]|eukprot:XP_008193545.1 PREDICTED: anoctamin-5 isoform X2 [Tribolium castaneum]
MPLETTKDNVRKNSITTSMSAPLLLSGQETSELSPTRRKIHKKRLTIVRHGDSLENDRFMSQPHILSYCNGEVEVKQRKPNSCDKLDMDAMSVVNLYKSADDLDSEMDTGRDFSDNPPKNKPRIIIPESSLESPVCDTQPNHNESSHKSSECRKNKISCRIPTIYFNDGMRSVDFVLVWDAFREDATTPEAYQKRKLFENNLVRDGLELEYVPQESNGLNFIKIHAPKEVLRRYSEILKLRMPMREMPAFRQMHSRTNFIVEGITSQWDKLKSYVIVDSEKFPEKDQRFTAIYSRDREYLFDVDSPCFFTPAIHSRIVQFILDRKRFSDNHHDDFAFGIERLLNDSVYSAAYPLHDGDLREPGSLRYLLYNEWTALSKWYRYQPLDYVKEYFGVKIALYFAWLGFYTHMLLPAAVVGLACFIYSCVTLYYNKPSEDICNGNFTFKMCPLCNHWCNYWDLKETCTHARITYLFDNATTVFFAIFMSFWAALFLELWKRYSAEITHRWDLTGFDIQEEHPRPQYLARLAHVKRQEVNVVTNIMEPHVPFWRLRVPVTIFSFSVVMLLVTLALATVVAIVVYRMSVLFALRVYADTVDNSQAILFTTCTAACINLFCIVIFNWIYNYVAEYLTEFELLRTQTEFDDSLTLKIYLLQFVNYYASIFYIAFIKGKFIGSPDDYSKLFGFRQEECGPGGCLMELCIQLAIIMIGKQAMNTVLEMLFPLFYKWLNTVKVKTGLSKDPSYKKSRPQWLKDYKLVEWGPRSLFPEYLEMVLQYGFVTIFVAAFPLAPFFALLNNVLEMRLDARKLITFYRRPVSQRVKDIGVWYRILDSIGKLSVVTNGFIIAFTSEFIPRIIYTMYVSKDHSLTGYLNFSLSYFNTSHFQNESAPRNYASEAICRYPDFRQPPESSQRYQPTAIYWHILAARLAFVVVFENIVAFIIIIIKWCIPDIPGDLKDRIRREAYITNEIIIKQETIRAQNGYLYPSPTIKREFLHNMSECPATPEQWDRLLSRSLEGPDFDLMVHAEGPGRRRSSVQEPSTT